MPLGTETVSFESPSGFKLSARIDWPEGEPRARAVFAHCFTCGKDISAARRIGRRLSERGIATLRFDFTGLGGSDGDFATSTFSSNVQDLLAAARFLATRTAAPLLLVGHSLGGTAALSAAQHVENLAGVVTLAAPCHPNHLAQLLSRSGTARDSGNGVELVIAGRAFRVQKSFFDDLSGQNLRRDIQRLGTSLLIFHSPQDRVVGIESARQIYDLARHPKSFVSLDGADHLLSRPTDAVFVADLISAWASRSIHGLTEASEDSPGLPAEEEWARDAVVVSEAGSGRFVQNIVVGHHRLISDEPVASGGQDRGPAPYDLLLASLGSCTSMTLRMYAEHKGIPLEKVVVRLRHRKLRAEECADCTTRQGRVDHIETEIQVFGDIDREQRQRLLKIAERCPVHRTLHSEVHIGSRLRE